MVQTRPPRPWAVVNKTQPKARLSRDTFAMSLADSRISEERINLGDSDFTESHHHTESICRQHDKRHFRDRHEVIDDDSEAAQGP